LPCAGCGAVVDATQEQIDSVVDQVLTDSIEHAKRADGVCPLCGHAAKPPFWNGLNIAILVLLTGLFLFIAGTIALRHFQNTERRSVTTAAIQRIQQNTAAVQILGSPIRVEPGIFGPVTRDETGWEEAQLRFTISGPKGAALVQVAASRSTGPWQLSTLDVISEAQHKKFDLLSGRVVEYDPSVYVDVHTMAAKTAEITRTSVPAPTSDGTYPCVSFSLETAQAAPTLGRCHMPTVRGASIDSVEVDLRYLALVIRQTDLRIDDVFSVPLTRSYRSDDWLSHNPSHAFGNNSNHPYDIAPLGTRNPYTYQMLVLEDGEYLYFDRISKGTGYPDAVYQHSETSTNFYKATTAWNGNGWTTRLADGSEIRFPESYSARNLAQGAATEMLDAAGNALKLNRDGQRNLKEILTPHGKWIRFEYDNGARVVRADTSRGEWAKYTYNTDGMLTSVANSLGHERHYTYEDRLLATINDEHGALLLRNTYQDGVVVQQEFPNGQVVAYRYTWRQHMPYADSITVILPGGQRQTIETASSVPAEMRSSR
jgi:YD repeat-containing protein